MNKKFNRSKTLFYLLVLIVLVSVALIYRVSYAYLEDYVSEGSSSDVKVNIKNSFMEFEQGGALVLDVSSGNLAQNDDALDSNDDDINLNDGDLTAVSEPKVYLYDTTVGSSKKYYTYLSIKNNTFKYTNSTTPEIILTITGPDKEEITQITGLDGKYVTNQGKNKNISGFDVTEYSNTGNPLLIKESSITSTGNEVTTDTWNFKLTYVNLDTDQSANLNKTFDINIVMLDHQITDDEKTQY